MTTTSSQSSEEQAIVEAVSADNLMAATRAIAQWVRLSGTPEEAQAFAWIERQLQAYGLETERYSHPALVSWPEFALLQITTASGQTETISCGTHAFSTPTPTEGISDELVYAGRGTADELREANAAGRIVLVDGIIAPNRNLVVEEAGVAGSIWIAGTYLHERILSPVWGTPTPETAHLLPKTPSISIRGVDGARLKELMAEGPLQVRMVTRVYRAWHTLPLLIANLRPTRQGPESDTFVMFSGHVDSWYYGAMDNGTANATMLEVGRILAAHRSSLRRGLRLAFWSGHSHARYGGSAWYADHAWQDLFDHCVAHVNVDSLGGQGATVLSEGNSMAELRDFASAVIDEAVGQRLSARRYGRSGDQSFWGHGIPALLMSLSEQPPEAADPVLLALHHQISGGAGRGGGLGWWWHTPEDTVDKIDPAFLRRDAAIYAVLLYRLCTARVLPLDERAVLEEMKANLAAIKAKSGTAFDFTPVEAAIAGLQSAIDRLNERIDGLRRSGGLDDAASARINRCLMAIGRDVIPVDYTRSDRFDHDLAMPTQPLPSLQDAARLAAIQPGTDEFEFLRTRLVRERNRVVFDLISATRAIDAALADLGAA